MDTAKWKSVLLPVNCYQVIKQISEIEGRSISKQLETIVENFCKSEGYEVIKSENT